MTYYCLLHPCEKDEIGYWGECPDFYAVASQGDSLEHALEMVKEALEGILEGMIEDNDPIPEPTDYSRKEGYYPIEIDSQLARRILERTRESIHA